MTIKRHFGTGYVGRRVRLFCAMILIMPPTHGYAESDASAAAGASVPAAASSAASAAMPAAASSAASAAMPASVPVPASAAAPQVRAAVPPLPEAGNVGAAPVASTPVMRHRVKHHRAIDASDRGAVVDYAQDTPSTLYMYKGEVKVIPVPGNVKRVAVGNGDVINASVADRQLLLLAQQAGDTSLVVWSGSRIVLHTKVSVSEQDRSSTLSRLRNSLGFVEDLHIDANGNRFLVRGKVHPEQQDLLKTALTGMPDVVNLIEADDGASRKRTIHFRMDILEISKAAERHLGIAWDQQLNGPRGALAGNALRTGRYRPLPYPATASFDGAPAATGGAFLGIATSITSRINLLVNQGDAYILASPELNSRSGGKATFLSGGEVPIPVSAGFGAQDVIYKEYGIRLEIAPTVDAHDNISTDLLTEISQIDPTRQVQGYPAFLTRRTTSQLSVRPGETLALAGLINADAATAVDKLPLLGDLPVLGHLFKSTDFRSNKSDLVVLVTPYLVDEDGSRNADLTEQGSDIKSDYRAEYGNPNPLLAANAKRSEALQEMDRNRASQRHGLALWDERDGATLITGTDTPENHER